MNKVSSTRIIAPTLARLPPLTSLRAFVASARHLSFTKAADELHVSSAAVGQQIRILEEYVGAQLFHRGAQQLQLTNAGRILMPGVTEAFEGLLDAVGQLGDSDHREPLRVSVAPSFASKWLIQRLERLRQAVPDLKVHVSATTALADVERDDVDCVIRYGNGAYSGLYVDHLFAESVVPMCSQDFADGYGLHGAMRNLQGIPLVHEEGPEFDQSCPDWNGWLRGQGMSVRFLDDGVRVNQSSLAIEAAVAGQGLALVKTRLAEADLQAGRLIVPFGAPQPVAYSYFFVAAPRKMKSGPVGLFRDWLKAEAGSVDARLRATGEAVVAD